MNYSRPILIMFLGFPGSGKSYFARQLASKIKGVRLNGDSMRVAMWGSLEEARKQDVDRAKNNQLTYGGLTYVADQILKAGHSVVYDAHHNTREVRKSLENLAEEYEAIPIVVWIKTPLELAVKRGQEREPMVDQHVYNEEKMREIIARHMESFDEPLSSENVISIDGTVDFESQFASFQEQIAKFL